MPFSAGTYTLPALNPVTTNTTISSTWANNTMSDIATALSTCMLKDGSQTITANIPMAGFKLTGLGAATTNGDAIRYEQVLTGATITGAVSITGLTSNLIVGGASIVQNSQSADYTLVSTDANKHILHPLADTNNRTFTIPANASVAFAIGTAVTFVNEVNTLTIAITTDTMTLAGAGSTGSRTLAANGIATALKLTATTWIISGTGIS